MHSSFEKIGQVLKSAWESNDMALLSANLARENLEWYEDVTDQPLTSIKAVANEWATGLAGQTNVHVEIKLLDAVGERGYYRCNASWDMKSGGSRVVDAIYIIELDDAGKIVRFLPWYTAKA